MEAVDSWIEEPIRDTEKPFLMPVKMYLLLLVVTTGRIETGTAVMLLFIGMGAEN
jgi:elongation factor Tu